MSDKTYTFRGTFKEQISAEFRVGEEYTFAEDGEVTNSNGTAVGIFEGKAKPTPLLKSITIQREPNSGRITNVIAEAEDGTKMQLPCKSVETVANGSTSFAPDFKLGFHSRLYRDEVVS